jgi:hypothetical protein
VVVASDSVDRCACSLGRLAVGSFWRLVVVLALGLNGALQRGFEGLTMRGSMSAVDARIDALAPWLLEALVLAVDAMC